MAYNTQNYWRFGPYTSPHLRTENYWRFGPYTSPHLRMETDPVPETSCSLEYWMMDKVQKPSNPEGM
jgi:hypothetical protein